MPHLTNTRSYICCKCLNRWYNKYSISRRTNLSYQIKNTKYSPTRTFSSGTYDCTSVETPNNASQNQESIPNFPKLKIRERLRQWESENCLQYDSMNTNPIISSQTLENSFNPVTHPFVTHLSVKSTSDEVTEEDILPTQELEDGLEGIKRDFLVPGDLVDLICGGNKNELAIFIQRLDLQAQYYTISGRWLHQLGTNVNIYFPNFVDPSELEELKRYLPREDVPANQEDALHGFEKVLPRTIGGPLLKKMKNFWSQANAIYETTASKLDESYQIVAHPTEFKYATISELADKILSGIIPRKKDGKFPDPALYALHRRIYCESPGFIPANLRKTRGQTQYEILPLNLAEEMSRVINYVRKFNRYNLSRGKSEKPTEIQAFAKKANELIRRSRQNRDFTVYGNIGPYKGKQVDEFKNTQREKFLGTNLEIVRFLEIWTGLNTLGATIGPTYDSAGSTILRAIGLYNNPDVRLNKQTGWTCLKEIGAITPWQTVAQYGIRAPNASCRLSLSPRLTSSQTDCSIDKMKDYRIDLKDINTYCIDDADALELDDGLSLEATDSLDEFWVHIHVADPTSILDPHGKESKYAQTRGNTVFLPGCKVPMLDHDIVMNHMSLAEGKLCLTISAKLNYKGELLDSKINPRILGKVICITPKTFAEVNNNSDRKTPISFSVGPRIIAQIPSRILAGKDQLSEKQQSELQILNKLGEARTLLLQKKGATFSLIEHDSLKIYFLNSNHQVISNNCFFPKTDPTIEVRLPRSYQDSIIGHPVTKSSCGTAMSAFMQLAGQIAADWCRKRNIPIPYRIALSQVSSQKLAEFHHLKILPFLEKEEIVPNSLISEYLALIGPVHLSAEPAPHPALAMEAYAKVTSPLRRFLDMVVHWQINAAIKQEAESNQTLVVGKGQNYLPFSKSWINSILPHMTRLERWAKYYENCSIQEWKCQFLLRSWKYSQSKLPSPLVFLAKRTVLGSRNSVFGELTCIAMKALMEIPGFMDFKDIKEGDLFEVEIIDLNIHSQKVTLKAIRKLNLEDIPRLDQEFGL
ncbi:Mitochondrial protein cyt-4 [Erysiphe necator]|nr:Mitochondrial protein cyt-4 [Erysiphe necator]